LQHGGAVGVEKTWPAPGQEIYYDYDHFLKGRRRIECC
jgi:hypothetical protein